MVVNVVEEVDVWLGLSNPGLSNPIQESDRMFCAQALYDEMPWTEGLYSREWPRSTASFVPKSITVLAIQLSKISRFHFKQTLAFTQHAESSPSCSCHVQRTASRPSSELFASDESKEAFV